MQLQNLAKSVFNDLGNKYHIRFDYQFVYPEDGGLAQGLADAVIFSSPIPSIQTAVIGFCLQDPARNSDRHHLSPFAYLGAPLLVTMSDNKLALYEFKGTPIAHKIESPPVANDDELGDWLRELLVQEVESTQLSFSFGARRELLIQDTRNALSQNVKALMELVREEKQLEGTKAFLIAMAVIRENILRQADYLNLTGELRRYSERLVSRLGHTLTFDNIPPESVAELYETFAVTSDVKRRHGIIYTPAWLARYVVNRLPIDAFRSGRAVDPTCGSGTFLVCFLERLVEETLRGGAKVTPGLLKQSVTGIDKDPVAIEAARLSLDFFCKTIGVSSPKWNLLALDATEGPIEGEWVIGNLPFGYRSHEGHRDISVVILETIEATNKSGRAISIILPDSLAYNKDAGTARTLLRSNYRIQEITRLPKSTFETSSAITMVVVGQKGKSPKEVVVREVTPQDLSGFKSGAYISRSYTSRFPDTLQDPWRFSPFNNEFEIAEKNARKLRDVAQVHIGLQIYGSESKVLPVKGRRGSRPLLTDTTIFSKWTDRFIKSLPDLTAEVSEVRRKGPWELFNRPKVIVRVTTEPGAYDRLAAIADYQGVWFTDKFAGIWPTTPGISINAIAAYMQTRFARAWFDTNNPSRKLRIAMLSSLPFPELPSEWWTRVASLVNSNTVIRATQRDNNSGLSFAKGNYQDWDWFNSAIEAALGLPSSSGAALEQWISNQAGRAV